jgi:hypothetical protein
MLEHKCWNLCWNTVKVVIDGNRLVMEHAQEMLEHRSWNADAETQIQKHNAETELELMLKHSAVTAETQCCYTC